MRPENNENLPVEAHLALAHTKPAFRDPLRIVLELDHRLGRIVAGTSEPMLGQMRLAWWRETLMQEVQDRPGGDAVLDAIGEHWAGREAALVALVDGWEHILAQPPLAEEGARAFATGRCEALLAVFGHAGAAAARERSDALALAAWRWALADLAVKVSLDEERELLVRLGLADRTPGSGISSEARGLAVLGALAFRALKRGGRPLMEGRGASLVAARAAILGR
jgi:phytoene synthase